MMMMHRPAAPSRKISRETVRRIARSFAPYRGQVLFTAIMVLGSAALGLLPPFFLRTLVNQGLAGRDLGLVTRYTLYTLLATIGGTVGSLAYTYLSSVVGQRIMRDLRNQLFDHLQG